jgi:hypothetical protein
MNTFSHLTTEVNLSTNNAVNLNFCPLNPPKVKRELPSGSFNLKPMLNHLDYTDLLRSLSMLITSFNGQDRFSVRAAFTSVLFNLSTSHSWSQQPVSTYTLALNPEQHQPSDQLTCPELVTPPQPPWKLVPFSQDFRCELQCS